MDDMNTTEEKTSQYDPQPLLQLGPSVQSLPMPHGNSTLASPSLPMSSQNLSSYADSPQHQLSDQHDPSDLQDVHSEKEEEAVLVDVDQSDLQTLAEEAKTRHEMNVNAILSNRDAMQNDPQLKLLSASVYTCIEIAEAAARYATRDATDDQKKTDITTLNASLINLTNKTSELVEVTSDEFLQRRIKGRKLIRSRKLGIKFPLVQDLQKNAREAKIQSQDLLNIFQQALDHQRDFPESIMIFCQNNKTAVYNILNAVNECATPSMGATGRVGKLQHELYNIINNIDSAMQNYRVTYKTDTLVPPIHAINNGDTGFIPQTPEDVEVEGRQIFNDYYNWTMQLKYKINIRIDNLHRNLTNDENHTLNPGELLTVVVDVLSLLQILRMFKDCPGLKEPPLSDLSSEALVLLNKAYTLLLFYAFDTPLLEDLLIRSEKCHLLKTLFAATFNMKVSRSDLTNVYPEMKRILSKLHVKAELARRKDEVLHALNDTNNVKALVVTTGKMDHKIVATKSTHGMNTKWKVNLSTGHSLPINAFLALGALMVQGVMKKVVDTTRVPRISDRNVGYFGTRTDTGEDIASVTMGTQYDGNIPAICLFGAGKVYLGDPPSRMTRITNEARYRFRQAESFFTKLFERRSAAEAQAPMVTGGGTRRKRHKPHKKHKTKRHKPHKKRPTKRRKRRKSHKKHTTKHH